MRQEDSKEYVAADDSAVHDADRRALNFASDLIQLDAGALQGDGKSALRYVIYQISTSETKQGLLVVPVGM